MAIPANGMLGSISCFGARANIKCTVFCPEDIQINIREINALGADTYLVNGFIVSVEKYFERRKKQVV